MTLDPTDSLTPSFTAPTVDSSELLAFEVTAQNSDTTAMDSVLVEIRVSGQDPNDGTLLGDFSSRTGWSCDQDPVAAPELTTQDLGEVTEYFTNKCPVRGHRRCHENAESNTMSVRRGCGRLSRSLNTTLSIRRLSPRDRPILDAFLDRHRASSMFLRANAFQSGLEDGPEPFRGLYMGAFDGDALTDAAAHYWNGNIVLQAPARPVELALAVARESGRPVNGLLGPWYQVQAVEPELDLDRARLGKVVPEYLYGLDLADLAVPKSLSSGRVVHRYAREDDLATLVPWRHEFDLHAMSFPEHSIDDAANRETLAAMIETNRLWVLEEAGCVVSMTGFNAALPDVVQVGGVFTPVEWRGRGHGRAVVAGSLLDARKEGVVEAILFTEAENRPAQRAYEALGFERIGDYGMVMLDPVQVNDSG